MIVLVRKTCKSEYLYLIELVGDPTIERHRWKVRAIFAGTAKNLKILFHFFQETEEQTPGPSWWSPPRKSSTSSKRGAEEASSSNRNFYLNRILKVLVRICIVESSCHKIQEKYKG